MTQFSYQPLLLLLYIAVSAQYLVSAQAEKEEKTDYYLPSLIIDPRNKFFSCDEPTIRVEFNFNRMFMTCPEFEFNTMLRKVKGEEYFEKLYHVKTEEEYRSCNATNGFPILTCDGTSSKNRQCNQDETTCTTYRTETFAPSLYEDDVKYYPGRTFYFIATSFRNKENLENKVGGSCSNTNNDNEYKIRFKVYVCSHEEVANGECNPAESISSYYKDCIDKCTAWTENEKEISQQIDSKCYIKERRSCTNIDTYVTRTEQRDVEIACPEHPCDAWVNTQKLTKINNTCTETHERTCTNQFDKNSYQETRQVPVNCPERQLCTNYVFDDDMIIRNGTCFLVKRRTCKELGIPYEEKDHVITECTVEGKTITLERTGDNNDNDDKRYLYIAIGASVATFLVGLLIGLVCCFCSYKKQTSSSGSIHSAEVPIALTIPGHSFENKGFSPTATEFAGGHVYDLIGNFSFGPDAHFGRLSSTTTEIPPIYHTALSRSASLQYTDEPVFAGPESVHYHTERPRRPGKVKVNRHSSAASRTLLMRHFSDLSDARRPRITSYASNGSSRPESMRSDGRPEIEIRKKEVEVINEV